MTRPTCHATKDDGSPCGATPLRDRDRCFWHDPATAVEAAEARRLGGLRRRRESTVQGAYDFHGLGSVRDIRRVLEVAAIDTLSLDNSIARARTLAYLSQVALRALEIGELEQRVTALEAAVGARPFEDSPFDALEPVLARRHG